VDDSSRMGGSERIRDFDGILHRVIQRYSIAGIRLLQRGAGNVFHRNEAHTIFFRYVVDSDDVGMIQPGRRPGLEQKASLAVNVGDRLRGKSLQGDEPLKPGVSRLVNFAHSPRAQERDDLVGANAYACGKRHKV
jgi:hypothetical protein